MEACERRTHSDWKCVNTGDPQGTNAPSSLFLVIVNDFKITPNLRKFVNDATLLEVLTRCFCPNQPTTVTKCEDCWTVRNNMKLNGTKTKGMDSWSLHQPAIQAYIVIVDHQIDMVEEAKLHAERAQMVQAYPRYRQKDLQVPESRWLIDEKMV